MMDQKRARELRLCVELALRDGMGSRSISSRLCFLRWV